MKLGLKILVAIGAMMLVAFAPAQKLPLHAQLAQELVRDIRDQAVNGILTNDLGQPVNLYGGSYADTYIKLKRDGNMYAESYAKCNSFVNRLLERAYNWNWKAMMGSKSPSATQYVQLIKNGTGFLHLPSFSATLPGDILAIDYGVVPDGAATGHVMIVKSVDWTAPGTYLGNKVYWVTVFDSSSGKHAQDTRNLPGGFTTSGGGKGVMGVVVDPAGNIAGYFWSNKMNASTFHAQADHEMVVGRLLIPGA